MTVSSFDHPFLSSFLGDAETAELFSAKADLDAMLAFEAALAIAEGAAGIIPSGAASAIEKAIAGFRPDTSALREATARDGVVVPELVRQLREAAGEHGRHVHFGATSQDVIDTSLALRLSKALELVAERLGALDKVLADLDTRFGQLEVMAHTRMQAAVPVPAARKIASWRDPLKRCRERLAGIRADVAILHFGGAAGTLDKLGDKADAVTEALAQKLGLAAVERARHSERDGVAAYASWLSLVTGSLGKMGQDIVLMAQSEVGEVRLASGGGSSAMPHKVNPVGAEALVALARFNATLVGGMHHALVHENERSGAAWTLEWLILPQMTVATGAALRTAAELLAGVSFAD
ncbi:MAG: 3-carboxy-cis,cis-muconate cycloisomerase [Rhizobiaceae bacterium]|nr:3-carboxy-cis,cis-muconate cycloisomerase [Rhizobiaceae bacterium]